MAAIPLIFGIQQITEGFVWISFGHPFAHSMLTYLFVLFSHVFWPFYLPLAVMLAEPGPRRKKALLWFVFFGMGVSLYLLSSIFNGTVVSSVVENCIVYQVPNPDSPMLLAAYLFATCASCQVSSHRFIRTFGLALFGSLLIALWSYRYAFYSVWCFFAAILSLIIYFHLVEKPQLKKIIATIK